MAEIEGEESQSKEELFAMDVMDGGRLPLEEWFWEMPVCTRWWTTATVLTSALVHCHIVAPLQLFYSVSVVWNKYQVHTAAAAAAASSLLSY